ncbi:Glycosyl hydrolase family 32 [Theobroma cacao]|nr:Glycosyl hydrolase family 32 [Theobroma cacao]
MLSTGAARIKSLRKTPLKPVEVGAAYLMKTRRSWLELTFKYLYLSSLKVCTNIELFTMAESVIWLVGLFFLLGGNVVQGSQGNDKNPKPSSTGQPCRTAYHFQPPKNWRNACTLSRDPYDFNGCWSGSTTFLSKGKPVILYTGVDTKNRQAQSLALPKNLSDPFLRKWVKSPHNPLMTPIDGIDPQYFRDPTTAWKGPDGLWRILVGNQMGGHGTALLYRSKDFVSWSRSEDPLHSSKKTDMWECPDFFPVATNSKDGVDTTSLDKSNKHVLKASFNHHDYYVLGKYTPNGDKFSVDIDFTNTSKDLRYDYGKFYASKTFFDSGKKRRILLGWVNESDSESDDIKKGWSGLQWPIQEIEKLHANKVSIRNKKLKGESFLPVSGLKTSQADVEVSFDLPNLKKVEVMNLSWVDPQLLCSQKKPSVRGKAGPFGLLVLASKCLAEHTSIFFRIFRNHDKYVVLMCSDQSRSSLREGLDKQPTELS